MSISGKIQLDVPSLLNSLGKSLYKEQEVALRELIQNAHDAISFHRRNLSLDEKNEYNAEVLITFKQGQNTLNIFDNGIGMSETDLREEFSRVGSSTKPEMLKSIIDSRGGLGERVIGQYGIGFLAAFLVADKVDVYSKKENHSAYHWSCDGTDTYYLEECQVDFKRGTLVSLKLKADSAALPKSLLGLDGIKSLAAKYSFLLQVPVYVHNTHINRFASYWKSSNIFDSLRDSDLNDFLRERFPVEFIDTFKLNHTADSIRFGEISFRATLFIGTIGVEARLFQGTSMEKASTGIDVCVKGMFVCRTTKFMPSWASFVHGVIDFDNLDLSLSREELIENKLFKQYQEIISSKILKRLRELKGTDKIARIVDLHRQDLIQGIATMGDKKSSGSQSKLFDELIELIPFKTSHGSMNIIEYSRAISEASKRYRQCAPQTIYCVDQKTTGAGESILAEDMGWPVLFTYPVELKILNDYSNFHDEIKIKIMSPDDLFFSENENESEAIEIIFKQQIARLAIPKLNVKVKYFRDSVPAMLLVEGGRQADMEKFFRAIEHASDDESMQGSETLRVMQALAEKLRSDQGEKILYVNGNNKIIKSIINVYKKNPLDESVLLACRTVYHSALLQSAHKSLSERDAQIIIENFNDTLSTVMDMTLKNKEANNDEYSTDEYDNLKSSKTEPYVFFIHSFSSKTTAAAIERTKKILLNDFQLDGLSASDEVRELTIPENVKHMIQKCKFGLADITGNNPNVMIEIGMLEMLGKPVIKIRDANDEAKIPIDIGVDLYCPYTAHKINGDKYDVGSEFVDNIKKHLKKAVALTKNK